jgi:hypothetical protein
MLLSYLLVCDQRHSMAAQLWLLMDGSKRASLQAFLERVVATSRGMHPDIRPA